MDLSAKLLITQKGLDEIASRAYKLSFRKRSVLLPLEKPQTLEYILQKTVFPHNEILADIDELIKDGFLIPMGGGGGPALTPASAAAAAKAPAPVMSEMGQFRLHPDIVLSEAKFLLSNFCVDTFGTQSTSFVDAVSACKNVPSLLGCLKEIYTTTETKYPKNLADLDRVIIEINESA